ncbi:hypothetical protein PLCT2_02688 [Planctomycetaceae bacterium]|nr:hypothetical protein PLCT2_02688 [Planctomycetaceae bacterium]
MKINPDGLEFSERGPKITERIIAEFEREIGSPLPGDYREFLLLVNGGYPSKSCFDCGEYALESVDKFYGLPTTFGEINEYSDLRQCRKSNPQFFPSSLLCIARDAGDNQLLLDLSASTFGQVYFWDHECGSEGGESIRDDLIPVAPDFSSFLHALKEYDENYRPKPYPLAVAVRENDSAAAINFLKSIALEKHRHREAAYAAGWAIDQKRPELVVALIPWIRDVGWVTHAAAKAGMKELVAALLDAEKTKDLELRVDPFGFTLLHELAATEHVEIAEMLIQRGADINAVAIKHTTPIMRARTLGNEKMVALFQRYGARS